MTEADPEQRRARVGAGPDEVHARTGALRRARPGAQEDAVELGRDPVRCAGEPLVVVAPDFGPGPELPQVLHEIEDEAVVVVDDEDAHAERVPTRQRSVAPPV